MEKPIQNPEKLRLQETYSQGKKWLKWGPYLSERQWGTVREDYSPNGTAWDYFPHDHARSRTYRWGEDGIAGISDQRCNLCFAVSLWNGKDPILKERLFGLTGPEGNHGEDVKELYYYLDSTPTHSYMKHLYKYPTDAFPYDDLVRTNAHRSKHELEYELLDAAPFDSSRYFDVFTEYAKADEEDICIRISVINRSEEAAPITILPTLWFRNRWSFDPKEQKPNIRIEEENGLTAMAVHPTLGKYHFSFQPAARALFTENETNAERLFGTPNTSPFVKDAFHRAVIQDDFDFLAGKEEGTKFAPLYQFQLMAGEKVEIRLRLTQNGQPINPLSTSFEEAFENRIAEANAFYSELQKGDDEDTRNIQRQAFAGMLWSKQYFHIDIPRWLEGDPGQTPPPAERKRGRNSSWMHLNNEDVVSMPDKWEYPWYAAWDLAFHCVPLAMADAEFAKNQLILFLREWYMHPNGQIPAYEWAFADVNPPVHAWACLQVYKIDKARNGKDDKSFLKRVFQKLLLNFTWWVNRKDHKGNNVFEGGFLGLDNIGVFDRSGFIPGGGYLEQADGTAWMAMYCLNMLEMALILAEDGEEAYEDVATKFFEHFVYISESLNRIGQGWTGSWDERDGFFYDILALPNDQYIPLRVRSLVGLTTLFAVLVLDEERLKRLPDFHERLKWFQKYRTENQQYLVIDNLHEGKDLLLSLVPQPRLERLLEALFDEGEFLGKGGVRSLSKFHHTPYVVQIEGQPFGLAYEPGESTTGLFGGNSNWRGPIWMPMNYLILRALETYHSYYGDSCKVEVPRGSGNWVTLQDAAAELSKRLISIFRKDESGQRPVHGDASIYHTDPNFKELVLFYEYFHGETARGVGASHQTGWTGLVAELIDGFGWK
ncbi:MAG: glucosidase [Haliscomenobacter sp.]|nr:glucosidase [Haliscomenobacter sp.]MBK8653416.1 glucosidase [Haliscomenobacter sp.]